MIQEDPFLEVLAIPINRNCVVKPLLEAISEPCLHMRVRDPNKFKEKPRYSKPSSLK